MKNLFSMFIAIVVVLNSIGCTGNPEYVAEEIVRQEIDCNNGVRDDGESDVDCGFACRAIEPPNLCNAGKHCETTADCNNITATLTCVNGICTAGGVIPPPTACSGGCPQGQSCVSGTCQAVPFGGTTSVSGLVVTCWGYPQFDGSTPNVRVNTSPNVLFICPSGFDGSFTVPVGVSGTCHNGHSNNDGVFGTLSTGAYGCQR